MRANFPSHAIDIDRHVRDLQVPFMAVGVL
jgi:hypothetical protein